ncbi:23 kDa integral membrane protein-like [Glandiceps talaboti]
MPASNVTGFQTKCIKNFLYLFNFVQVVCALSLCALCLYVHFGVRLDDYGGSKLRFMIYGSITMCVLMCVTGIVGCYATRSENVCLLGMFFAVLTGLMLTVLSIGVAIAANRTKLVYTAQSTLSTMVQEYYDKEDASPDNKLVDWLQTKFQCCGLNGPDDWKLPPLSCYCQYCDDKLTFDVHTKGCLNVVSRDAKLYVRLLYSSLFTIGFSQLLGLVYSMKLLRHFRKQRNRRNIHCIYSAEPECSIANNNWSGKLMTTTL